LIPQSHKEELERKWRESAFYYNKHRRFIEKSHVPLTHAVIQKAKLFPGAQVLDIATGIGEPALSIAKTYGNSVNIIATDLILPMLQAARAEAAKRKYQSIQFCRCAGDEFPFANQSFNAIVCRFAFNFFSDPVKSLKNMIRTLNPSGRVVLVVWHDLKFNPVHDVVNRATDKIFPSKPDPIHDSDCGYENPGMLASLLVQTGFNSVEEDIFDFIMQLDLDLEEYCQAREEISDHLRDKLPQMSNEQKDQLFGDIRNGFRPYFKSGSMRVPAKVIIVTGQK
jgi:ubiquinone/menaquinone biosynthesis C-methylase UbiE